MEESRLLELVRRAGGGEREATEELIRAYHDRIRERVSRRVGPRLRLRLDTDDILQSSMVLAFRDLEGKPLEFEGETAFLAWLMTIAERKIRMRVRYHGQQRRDVDKERPEPSGDLGASQDATPSQYAMSGERRDRVRAALAMLEDEDRLLIEMRVLEGLTFKEIATRLNRGGEEATRQRYARLLPRIGPALRTALGDGHAEASP